MKKQQWIRDVLACLCMIGALLSMLLMAHNDVNKNSSASYQTRGIVGAEAAEIPTLPEDFILNTGTAADFDDFPGIGPVLADRIVAYRAKNGPFKYLESLLFVEGIGTKKMRTIRDYLIEQGLYEPQPVGTVTYENTP